MQAQQVQTDLLLARAGAPGHLNGSVHRKSCMSCSCICCLTASNMHCQASTVYSQMGQVYGSAVTPGWFWNVTTGSLPRHREEQQDQIGRHQPGKALGIHTGCSGAWGHKCECLAQLGVVPDGIESSPEGHHGSILESEAVTQPQPETPADFSRGIAMLIQ